jgi:hypothetical protein
MTEKIDPPEEIVKAGPTAIRLWNDAEPWVQQYLLVKLKENPPQPGQQVLDAISLVSKTV